MFSYFNFNSLLSKSINAFDRDKRQEARGVASIVVSKKNIYKKKYIYNDGFLPNCGFSKMIESVCLQDCRFSVMAEGWHLEHIPWNNKKYKNIKRRGIFSNENDKTWTYTEQDLLLELKTYHISGGIVRKCLLILIFYKTRLTTWTLIISYQWYA